jgi:hypothetical protein
MMAKAKVPETKKVVITAPDLRKLLFKIQGTAPYVQLRFSEKKKKRMMDAMTAEGQAAKRTRSKAGREPREFEGEYEDAMYQTAEGLRGIPAAAFRVACISACRLVNFKMTLGKLSLFCEASGIDEKEGIPLVILKGDPERVTHTVTNADGSHDVRTRAMWRKWTAEVIMKYDADQFQAQDVINLLMRVGMQVGIGEGRHDSKSSKSAGMGWGTFDVVKATEVV